MGLTSIYELREAVWNHSPLLQGNCPLREQVASIPGDLAETPEAKLLNAIMHYHDQHVATNTGGTPNWQSAYDRFKELEELGTGAHAPVDCKFYIWNYLFLSGRNADEKLETLTTYAENAERIAQKFTPPDCFKLAGFIIYNVSRLLHKMNKVEEAKRTYVEAAKQRKEYYLHICHLQTAEVEIRGAATQVWKMRKDWTLFFGTDPDILDIDDELYAEVAAIADPNFSVTKKDAK